MPVVMLYLLRDDVPLLVSRLNDDPDVAWIVADGDHWRAVRDVEDVPDGGYALWHVRSGPLVVPTALPDRDVTIADPWSGFRAPREGRNFGPAIAGSMPYFVDGRSYFRLDLRTNTAPVSTLVRDPDSGNLSLRGEPDDSRVRLTSIQWTGDHYSVIGQSAPADAKKWWNRFAGWVRRVAVKTPRADFAPDDRLLQAWALPAAHAAIARGMPRDS